MATTVETSSSYHQEPSDNQEEQTHYRSASLDDYVDPELESLMQSEKQVGMDISIHSNGIRGHKGFPPIRSSVPY